MKTLSPVEKARRYFEAHEHDADGNIKKKGGPCITISRETGTGADRIGEKLIEYFAQFEQEFTLFDKNLIDKILEDNSLPHKLTEYFPEDKSPALRTTMNELLGLQPPMMKLLHKAAKSIYSLALMGNVILVGRAANIITAKLPNCFHIRLVAPHHERVQNMQHYYNMNPKEALEFVDKEDKARSKYVEANYNANANDPNAYHMVVNVSLFSIEEAAEIIGNAVVMKYPARFVAKEYV